MKKKIPATKDVVESQRWTSKSFTWVKAKRTDSEKMKAALSFENWTINPPGAA